MQYDVCFDAKTRPLTVWEVDKEGQQIGPKWISHGLNYRYFRLECEKLTHRLGIGAGLRRFDIFEEIISYEASTAFRRQFISGYGKLFHRDWELKSSLFGSDAMAKYFVHLERSSNLGECGAKVRGYSLDEGDSVHFLIRISNNDFDALVKDIDRVGRGNLNLFFERLDGVYEVAYDSESSSRSAFQLRLMTSKALEGAKRVPLGDVESQQEVSVLGKLEEYEIVAIRTLGIDAEQKCLRARENPEDEKCRLSASEEFVDQRKRTEFAGGSAVSVGDSMMSRLGNVLGWAGNILGLAGIGLGLLSTEWFGQVVLVCGGLVLFLLGRALRYVFSGSLA